MIEGKLTGIRLKFHDTTRDIHLSDCHYMELGYIGEGAMKVPGVWYKLDASKWPVPIEELDVFAPLTNLIQLFIKR
jgi:hypothetical protein